METLRFVMASSFYPPYHLGGDAVHVKYLAEALSRQGHEVHVMHSLDAYYVKRKDAEPKEQIDSNVTVHSLKSPHGRFTPVKVYGLGSSNFITRNFSQIVKLVDPDVVHHHNISLLGHNLFRKYGNYLQLYTAHDYWLKCQRNDLMNRHTVCETYDCISCALRSGRPPQLWRKKLKTNDLGCVICPSEYMQSQLREIVSHSKVLHNFVPEPPENIKVSGHEDYYLFIGLMEPHKGVLKLLDAFVDNQKKLLFVGKGSLGQIVSDRIKKDNLAPRIQYLNWVEDKWPLLKDAKAVIIPSLWPENCPLVALEAMSVGTPVITSDMGGTKEVASMISPDLVLDTIALDKSLEDIPSPAFSREMVIKTFQDNFSEARYLKRYIDLAMGEAECI